MSVCVESVNWLKRAVLAGVGWTRYQRAMTLQKKALSSAQPKDYAANVGELMELTEEVSYRPIFCSCCGATTKNKMRSISATPNKRIVIWLCSGCESRNVVEFARSITIQSLRTGLTAEELGKGWP